MWCVMVLFILRDHNFFNPVQVVCHLGVHARMIFGATFLRPQAHYSDNVVDESILSCQRATGVSSAGVFSALSADADLVLRESYSKRNESLITNAVVFTKHFYVTLDSRIIICELIKSVSLEVQLS